MQVFIKQFEIVFRKLFNFSLTKDQENALFNLIKFISDESFNKVFVLKGYAGTGKTTFISTLVQTLKYFNRKSVLMAPTGRAAKVFSNYSKNKAFTIHKKIYTHSRNEFEFSFITLSKNFDVGSYFMVDEASMISSENFRLNSNRDLLDDLFNYVFSSQKNSLIFLGDESQLPPVNSNFSPALNIPFLKSKYPKISFYEVQLKQIIRQKNTSQIIFNSKSIRECKDGHSIKLKYLGIDVFKVNSIDLQEYIEDSFAKVGVENCIILSKSNIKAGLYNQVIRKKILFFEEILEKNEKIMVVKNSYFWVDEKSEIGFIANGEILTIVKVLKIESRYNIDFAHVIVSFDDYPEMENIKVILNLKTLCNDEAQLSKEDSKKLFYEIENDYLDESDRKKRIELVLNDQYFNALQIKYAYCVTTHKAQGGQWSHVYIDHGKLDENYLSYGFQSWLYTSLTRAKDKVFLINFDEKLFIHK